MPRLPAFTGPGHFSCLEGGNLARIRTIKPEFSQSETIGKLSRNARLLFIQLWTFVDDHGRSRGNSRLLAASLYPYDDDALALIDGWIAELEALECVRRYTLGVDTYLEIPNWSKHQRIDNAGKSRIPENSSNPPRTAANGGDPPLYLGPRTIGPRNDDEEAKSSISPEAILLTNEITKIAGHDIEFPPPGWVGGAYRVQMWLTKGWPREAILASVQKQMAAKKGSPPSTVQYFEKGIADFIAQQSAPLPVGNQNGRHVQKNGGIIGAADELVEFARRAVEAEESALRSGDGAQAVRLLPKG